MPRGDRLPGRVELAQVRVEKLLACYGVQSKTGRAAERLGLGQDPLGLGAARRARVREAGIHAGRRDRPRTVGGAEAGEEDEVARAYDGAGVAERHGACGRYDFLAHVAAGPRSDDVYRDEPAHAAEIARV